MNEITKIICEIKNEISIDLACSKNTIKLLTTLPTISKNRAHQILNVAKNPFCPRPKFWACKTKLVARSAQNFGAEGAFLKKWAFFTEKMNF